MVEQHLKLRMFYALCTKALKDVFTGLENRCFYHSQIHWFERAVSILNQNFDIHQVDLDPLMLFEDWTRPSDISKASLCTFIAVWKWASLVPEILNFVFCQEFVALKSRNYIRWQFLKFCQCIHCVYTVCTNTNERVMITSNANLDAYKTWCVKCQALML